VEYYFSFLKKILLLLLLASLTACASNTQFAEYTVSPVKHNAKPIHKVFFSGGIWSDIREDFSLPDLSSHPAVKKQIAFYQRNSASLERSFLHSIPFIYYTYQETKRRGLPAELALLPILESGYSPYDTSSVGANGLWQIMPGTARSFGLKMNAWYDGRRDTIASTRVALKYLTYLHEYCGDWLLALASYDAGEGSIQASIGRNLRTNSPIDFWSLHLPKETEVYVPKLLALAAILRDPERYNIALPAVENKPYFKIVDTGSQIDLKQAAKLADMSLNELHTLNAAYRRSSTDPDGPYILLLPIDKADIFSERWNNLPANEKVAWKEPTVIKHSIKAKNSTLKKHSKSKHNFKIANKSKIKLNNKVTVHKKNKASSKKPQNIKHLAIKHTKKTRK